MSADTILYMGSLSKILTAVLALNIVEGGRLSLDDSLTAHADRPADPIDGRASQQAITMHQLLTHSSGLDREGDFGYWFSGDFPSNDALLDYLAHSTLRFEPGTDIRYSNVGYAAIGAQIQAVTQQSFASALEEHVLEPLGMADSGVAAVPDRIANGYTPPNRMIPSMDRPFAGVGDKVGDRWVRMYHDAAAMSPAFGIYSTANDLVTLARFLLGHGHNDVLSQTMRREMGTRQPSGWGLGLKVQRFRGVTVNRHDGWFAAHRSHLLIDRTNDIGVVVMANGDNANTGGIADALYDAVLAARAANSQALAGG